MKKNNLKINTALIDESYVTTTRYIKFDDDGKKYVCYVSDNIADQNEIDKEIESQIKQEKLLEKFFRHFNFEFNNQN